MQLSRRELIKTTAASLCLLPVAAHAYGADQRSRVVLLGTKGGPRPSPLRAAASVLLMVAGRAFVVDCGDGVATQIAKAGVGLDSISQVFITHNHSDHMIDLAALVVLAWGSGPPRPIQVHGPSPIKRSMALSLDAMEYDITARMREDGRPPLKPLVRVNEIDSAGVVFEDSDVRVTSALVDHYTVKPAFAYRFDMHDRSVVISGDTTYSENLIALAQGADLLIHEAMYLDAIDQIASQGPPSLRDHLIKGHTTTEQLGMVAAKARVKKLVLSHLAPAFPTITDAMWLKGVRQNFKGEAVVGRDLMEL